MSLLGGGLLADKPKEQVTPKTFWNTFWSLWNCTRAQRTLLDHHGPPNGPQNGSCEANFGGPLVKKGPPGPLMVQIDQFS